MWYVRAIPLTSFTLHLVMHVTLHTYSSSVPAMCMNPPHGFSHAHPQLAYQRHLSLHEGVASSLGPQSSFVFGKTSSKLLASRAYLIALHCIAPAAYTAPEG